MAEQRIVEAVFTSANASALGVGGKSPLAKMIEQAMSEAVLKCHAAGIFDPDEVRKHMLEARAVTKAWFNMRMAEAAEAYAKQLAAEG